MLKFFSALLVLMTLATLVYGQESIKIQNPCSPNDGQTMLAYEADEDTKDLVFDIIALTGLDLQIRVLSAENIKNVAAYEDEKGKSLVIKKSLIKTSEDNKNLPAVIAICQQLYYLFAGEELKNYWTCQEMATEADRFAGHILYQLEVSLEASKSAMNEAIADPSIKMSTAATDRINEMIAGWEETKAFAETEPTYASVKSVVMPIGPNVSNPKTIRLNDHLILKRSTYPILKESWNSGFRINESIYQNGQWYVVMTEKTSDFLSQAMRLRKEWPEDDIKKLWDDKHDISRIEYYNNVWFLCMTKSTKSVLQRWRTRLEFPDKEITKSWNDGYYIIDMSYGDSLYALILDKKSSDYKTQTWIRRSYFPSKEIEEQWAKNHQITLLKYLNGEWVLVMTKFTNPKKQKWFRSNTFPSEIIEEQEGYGYRVKGLNYGPNQWILLVEEK